MKRTGCGTLRAQHAGERVKLQAWVHRRRDHGGVTFLDLRDRSGLVQVVVRREEHPEPAAALEAARIEWVVEVEGEVLPRAEQARNPNLPTGDVEVHAARGVVLARSLPVPFSAESALESSSEETRLKYRFLDLRRSDLQRNLLLRHRVSLEILRYFDEQGFITVETPILTRSTPEGARDFLVPSRVHKGQFFALPQSPQLFKQILMVRGFERYVQIARCFRDEDQRADRQLEFTQVDVEMSFVDEEDVYALIEGLLRRVFPLVGVRPPDPLPRLPYRDAILRYGSDKPDLRVDLAIRDLSEALRGTSFPRLRVGARHRRRHPGFAGAGRGRGEPQAARRLVGDGAPRGRAGRPLAAASRRRAAVPGQGCAHGRSSCGRPPTRSSCRRAGSPCSPRAPSAWWLQPSASCG